MALLKKILRITGYMLLVLLAFVGGAIAVLTLTATGRESLAGMISTLASSPGQTVRISGLSGIWIDPLKVDEIVVEDGTGPWLALRGVEIEWSRLALLASRFDATRISAQRVEVARQPQSAPVAAPANSEPFSLPVSVSIKSIDLPNVALGPALAGGRVASVSAQGGLTAEASPLAVQTNMRIERRDGTAGDLDASVEFVPSDNILNVSLRASEPSGGILASLLKLPDAPSVDIIVSGAGTEAGWSGSGTFALDGKIVTTLSGKHRFTDDGNAIEAKGDGEFARFVPERFRALIEGKSEFDVAGSVTNAGGVEIERATVQSSALNATASGSLDPNGASDFLLDVSAKAGGIQLSFGTEESPIDLTVAAATIRAFGSGKEPALDIEFKLPSVETVITKLNNLDLTLHSDGFNIASRTGPVTGTATASSIVIDNPTIAPLIAGAIRANLAGVLSADSLVVDAASLQSDAIDGSFGGTVSLADGTITLDLQAEVLSSALPAAARPLLGEKTRITTSLARDAEGNVSANALDIKSGGLTGGGVIRVAGEEVDAEIKGMLADVGTLSPQATGAISFEATAKGPLASPDISATITGDRLTVAAREITGLKLTATGKADLASPAANISLEGMVGGEALAGSAVLSTADGRRVLDDLSLSLGQNIISGDLVLDENFAPIGTVDFDLPDIGPLAALALDTAEGDLRGKATFGVKDGVPELSVNATAGSVKRGDVSAKDVAIAATVQNYLVAPVVAGSVRAANAISGTTIVQNVDVALTQDGSWTGFQGSATVSGVPARADGRVQIADGKTVIELKSAEATVNGVKIPLGGSTGVTIENGAASLNNIEIDLGGGKATISGTTGENLDLDVSLTKVPASLANPYVPNLDAAGLLRGTARITGSASNPAADFSVTVTGAETAQTRAAGLGPLNVTATGKFADKRLTFQASVADRGGLTVKGGGSVNLYDPANPVIDVDLQLAALPASVVNSFALGLNAAGSISGTVKATGTANDPTIAYTLNWEGARTTQIAEAGFGAMTIRSSGTFANKTLKFDASGGGGGLTMKGGGTVTTAGAPQLNLDFDGTVPFSFLTQRLAAQGLSLSGAANVSLRIKGAASAPVIEGTVNASGARFVDARTGIAINDISAEVRLGGGRATIARLAGTLSTGGSLSASGSVGLAAGFPADLAIQIRDGRYTDGEVVTTTLSGDLTLKGPLVSTPLLSGRIDLGRTVITVPERLSGSLATLDVQHQNAPADVIAQDKALRPSGGEGGGGGGLTLDITVNAPQQIFIQGRGLDAELGGSLRLTGRLPSPEASGQFTMRRGRLSVLGRRLTFTRGTLGFSGSLIPYLDLEAQSDASDATVTVLVTGPANNPKFVFSSIPSLPEDEVLARLVFGRSMSDLSPVQIAQLAEAAGQFAGVGGPTSLLTTLRGKIGVDDLDLKTNAEGDTSLAVGKYLNDRTYLTIESSGRAAIDLDVGKGVKLRGEAGADGEAKGGIFFEREY